MKTDKAYEDGLWPERELRTIRYEPAGGQEQGLDLLRIRGIEVGGWLAAFMAWLVFC